MQNVEVAVWVFTVHGSIAFSVRQLIFDVVDGQSFLAYQQLRTRRYSELAEHLVC